MAAAAMSADGGHFRRVIHAQGILTPEEAIFLKVAIEMQLDNRVDEVAEQMQLVCPAPVDKEGLRAKIVRKTRAMMRRAEIVIWDDDIWRSAWNSGLGSADALCGDVLTKEGMDAVSPAPEFWMQSPMTVGSLFRGMFDVPDRSVLAGILVSPGWMACSGTECRLAPFPGENGGHEHYGVQFVFFWLPTSEEPSPTKMAVVTTGAIYPAMVGERPIDLFAPLFSCGRFLRTRFVDLRPAKSGLSRQQHRLAERKGKLPDISRVKTVCLRRRAESPHLAGNGGKEIEWQHQWVVSPHWRKQWYPSKGVHEPVYVESYLMGPEGKPLLPPRSTVYVVKR